MEREEQLLIELDGTPVRPICHIELPVHDYEENKKIIYLESIGTRTKNYFRFNILNTTGKSYNFTFNQMDKKDEFSNYFQIIKAQGFVSPGKKFEIEIIYNPEKNGVHRVAYLLEIPEHQVKQEILVRGKVTEPKIFFDLGKIDFGP